MRIKQILLGFGVILICGLLNEVSADQFNPKKLIIKNDDEKFIEFVKIDQETAKDINNITIYIGPKNTTYINYYIDKKLIYQRIAHNHVEKTETEILKDFQMSLVVNGTIY